MSGDKLVTMANQIAAFHQRRPLEEAATEVAAHLGRFWEPRMRKAIQAQVDLDQARVAEAARTPGSKDLHPVFHDPPIVPYTPLTPKKSD